MNKDKPLFWPWLAGFIDGDGCFILIKNKVTGGRIANISISQKNRKILEYIQSQVGFGCVTQNKRTNFLVWSSNQAQKILFHINKHLRLKKKQGELLLQACRLSTFCRKRSSQPRFVKAYHTKLSIIDKELRDLKKMQVA